MHPSPAPGAAAVAGHQARALTRERLLRLAGPAFRHSLLFGWTHQLGLTRSERTAVDAFIPGRHLIAFKGASECIPLCIASSRRHPPAAALHSLTGRHHRIYPITSLYYPLSFSLSFSLILLLDGSLRGKY